MSGKIERDNFKSNTTSPSSVSRIRDRNNYDTWEHAYFPYLLDMYKLTFDDPMPDHTIMYKFFRFIYSVSSGSITPFLKTMSKVEEEAYFEFKLKRKI